MRDILVRKKINIIILVFFLVLISLGMYKINRYEKYFIEENNSQMVSFCLSIIKNQEIFNEYDYMNIPIEEIVKLNTNYGNAIDSYMTMRNRVKYFEEDSYKSSEYIAVSSDCHYYINKYLLNGVYYDISKAFPDKIKITEAYKRIYKNMSELNEIYYTFLMGDVVDAEYYTETGTFRFGGETNFRYWSEIITELNDLTEEYLTNNRISNGILKQ